MKKAILFLICFTINKAFSQQVITQKTEGGRIETFITPFGQSMMVWPFSPGKGNCNFYFYNVSNKVTVQLELSRIYQVDLIPNLDSIAQLAIASISPLLDSFKLDGIPRRIDYRNYTGNNQITIHENPASTNNYVIDKNELKMLKVYNDTLRIMYVTDKTDVQRNVYRVMYITFITPNLSELKNLKHGVLSSCTALLKEKTVLLKYGRNTMSIYNASFNMKENRMFSPSSVKWMEANKRKNEFTPNLYASTQLLNGQVSTSVAVGVRYSYGRWRSYRNQLYLMWEPYFFFTNQNNSIQTFRNDFITLRLREGVDAKRDNNFNFQSNISIGYLVGRRGNYFNENTFKIGFPGVSSGLLQLEPEFIFNNFFKNFSPGLRLTLHFE
jgi:hypothetical protein